MAKTKLTISVVTCLVALLGACTPKPKEVAKASNEAAIENQVAVSTVPSTSVSASSVQSANQAAVPQNPPSSSDVASSLPATSDTYTSNSAMPQNPHSPDNKGRATTAGVNAEVLRLRASGVEIGAKIPDEPAVPTSENQAPQ